MWGFLRLAAAAAIITALVISRPKKTMVEEVGTFDDRIEGELGRFVGVINSVNSEQDETYVAALKRLRDSSDDVIAEAKRLLVGRSDTPFAVRHSVILAIASLHSADALDLLSLVALNPQPLPPVDDPHAGELHHHGAEEAIQGEMLSLDAIDGIEALADKGIDAALDVLVRAAGLPSNAIRGAALTALAAKPERRAEFGRAMATLPAELRHLGQLRRVQIEDVPQIRDPRVHLAGKEIDGASIPPIAGERKDRAEEAPLHGAPVISRS